MLCGTACLAIKKQYIYKMSVVEMRMLRWISLMTWKNRNEESCIKIGATPIDEKMRENHIRWYDQVLKRAINAPVRKRRLIQFEEMKKR